MAYQTAKFAGTSRAAPEGPSFSLRAGVVAMMLALAGCGSGSGQSPGGGMPLVATLPSIQANVFSVSCAVSNCHTGATPPQGLRLDDGQSWANLVNQPSPYGMMLVRVVPFDPDGSFLIQKLEPSPPAGERMPANGPPYLSPATIAVIRDWIANGAQP
jgi:hypothetical protein